MAFSKIESVYDWIEKQNWPTSKKAAAVILHERSKDGGWNPLTLAQWAKWSARFDATYPEEA